METRELILSHAFRLFLRKGYPNVSISELVSSVGVTKGGFYHHFKSKDDLYVEVINVYFLALVDRITGEITRPAVSVQEALRRLVDLTLESYQELTALSGPQQFRGMIALMFSGLDRFDHVLRRIAAAYQEMLEVVARIINEGKNNGEIRPEVDSMAAAFSLMALGEGTVVLWAIDQGTEDREGLLNLQFDILWRGIASLPPGRDRELIG